MYGKRKFKEATEELAESFTDALPDLDKLKIYSDCEELMGEFKRKFLHADTGEEKIQILTLVPNNWSRSRAARFFNTSEYLVRSGYVTMKKGLCDC